MSWTKRQFTERAFSEIGLASYVYTLTPDQLQFALTTLDAMMGEWDGLGIKIGWPFTLSPEDSDLDTETGAPLNAQTAIFLNLGKQIAPSFGKTLSNDTKTNARGAFNQLLAHHTKPARRKMPSTMPSGAGNKTWRYNNDPFIKPECEC